MANFKTKTVNVICEFNPDHIIEKNIEIQNGTQKTTSSTINAYCPFCDKWTNGQVQGEMVVNDSVLREFDISKVSGSI